MQERTGNPTRSRVESLDVLRGLAVAGMIVVNNPGDWSAVFPPLMHAYWTGLTVADLVFPSFIVVMGIGVPLAFANRRAAGTSASELHKHMARRVLLLVALGLALNAVSAWPDVWPLRSPGVLQRIAFSYLVASLVVLHMRPSLWLAVAAALMLGHWALLALVPFDGHPAGTLTPDHNLARFVDARVFGDHALAIPIDPEGLLGTLTAAASAILGAVAGERIRQAQETTVPAASNPAGHGRALAAAALAIALGLVWCPVLPLSKPLWTGSFVLVTAGLTMLALGVIGFVLDVRGLRHWCRPFVWLGANAIVIYVGSEIVRRLLDSAWIRQESGLTTPKAWLFWEWLEPAFRPRLELASFVFALGVVLAWTAVGATLYRRQTRQA